MGAALFQASWSSVWGGQNAWISLGRRGPRSHGQQRAQHFSRLVGAQCGKPECFPEENKVPEATSSEGRSTSPGSLEFSMGGRSAWISFGKRDLRRHGSAQRALQERPRSARRDRSGPGASGAAQECQKRALRAPTKSGSPGAHEAPTRRPLRRPLGAH